MHNLYILESKQIGRRYIGVSSDVVKRLEEHNNKKVRSTKAYVPWALIHKEEYATKREARVRELELKNNSWKRKDLFERINRVAPSSNG
ncbi:MAG: GIY-YIG nuclease family protein [Candidatus Sungbacteria bacterium]|uniref:GIY-YIG nuclease family protein n=1 Tax=Candidatus Sungiibacteriota bacterium TaxID=2750080 RepID=A0A931WNR8_9BACT|nr:GIY-YIG nuclease family protein [Candidatus Sungbacteria bacterium]